MAANSAIPAVKSALVTILDAALDVQVFRGPPGAGDNKVTGREFVWVGDVTGQSRIPTMKAGRKAREEAFTVEVFCVVLRPRGQAVAAETDCFALYAAVEDALADDPSLGGVDGLTHAWVESFEVETSWADEGVTCVLRTGVYAETRLT